MLITHKNRKSDKAMCQISSGITIHIYLKHGQTDPKCKPVVRMSFQPEKYKTLIDVMKDFVRNRQRDREISTLYGKSRDDPSP